MCISQLNVLDKPLMIYIAMTYMSIYIVMIVMEKFDFSLLP